MGFGLYIHWPFCESKCPYCDFNSHVAARIDHGDWISAYRHEIQRTAAANPDEVLDTIFFGGGTPSLMAPETVDAVISTARAAWRCANDVEITMEANPGSVEAGRFAAYRQAGVNRVSLGIQSLDNAHLRYLGRKHDRDEAVRAIGIAQNTFERVNLDLIYARQHQTLEHWQAELDSVIAFGTGHLSLYQLTIEDGTVFAQRHAIGKLPGLPSEDISVNMYLKTQEICDRAGLTAYEVSNHAKPGQECRHNMLYWQGGGYAGVGPGAHGRLGRGKTRRATEAIREPGKWLSAVAAHGSGEQPELALSHEDQAAEMLMMGLRLDSGITLQRLRDAGIDLVAWESLKDLVSSGHLTRDDTGLRATAAGRMLLNSVIARLLSDIPLPQS